MFGPWWYRGLLAGGGGFGGAGGRASPTSGQPYGVGSWKDFVGGSGGGGYSVDHRGGGGGGAEDESSQNLTLIPVFFPGGAGVSGLVVVLEEHLFKGDNSFLPSNHRCFRRKRWWRCW